MSTIISITGLVETTRGLKSDLAKFTKDFSDDFVKTAKSFTPVRTGNAKKGWQQRPSTHGANIENKVPYIGRLEAGASRKAPQGIIGPTLTTIKGKYK